MKESVHDFEHDIFIYKCQFIHALPYSFILHHISMNFYVYTSITHKMITDGIYTTIV